VIRSAVQKALFFKPNCEENENQIQSPLL